MSRFRGFQGNREESAAKALEKEHDITKGSDQEPLDAELEAARRMKDGLAEYKRGFSKRVAGYAAIFVVGVAVGAWVFGTRDVMDRSSDWVGDMAAFHAIGGSLKTQRRSDDPRLKDIEPSDELPDLNFGAYALLEVQGIEVFAVSYQTKLGVPVAHYQVASQRADLSDPVVGLRHGMQGATWTKGGVEHLLIGDVDAAVIWDAAKILAGR